MTSFDDSSSEMHTGPLTPDTAERLLAGENSSLELADLAALVNEVRAVPGHTPTPMVEGALAEFVGVGLTTTDAPLDAARTPRSRKMITSLAAFAGTVGGKVVLGTTLAAASVTGAHATGVVDVPILPDVSAVEIEVETEADFDLDVNEPDALGFIDDETDASDATDESDVSDEDDVFDGADESDVSDESDELDSDDENDVELLDDEEIEMEGEGDTELEIEVDHEDGAVEYEFEGDVEVEFEADDEGFELEIEVEAETDIDASLSDSEAEAQDQAADAAEEDADRAEDAAETD